MLLMLKMFGCDTMISVLLGHVHHQRTVQILYSAEDKSICTKSVPENLKKKLKITFQVKIAILRHLS